MKEEKAEQILSVLYISCALLSMTSLICFVIVWQYWTYTLDVCDSINCGCILYSINTFASFTGGDEKFCQFGVYGLIPAVFLTILLCCLSLAHAIVMTDGYYKSCEQYRKRLIYLLNSGREAEVIRNRLSCEAIFDFMDYLEADMTDNNKWIMNKQIDTAFAFQLAIISTWLNFFVWTCAFLLNIIMARKRFH